MKDGYVNRIWYEPLNGSSFTLSAGSGDSRSFEVMLKSYAEMVQELGGISIAPFLRLNENILYGSKIVVTEVTGNSDGSTHTEKTTYFLYRFIDATDADHNDKLIEFEDTLVNGTRDKKLTLKTGSATPQLNASGAFSISGSNLQFNPTVAEQNQTGSLNIKTPTGKDVDTLNLRGDGEPQQEWFVDVDSTDDTDKTNFLDSIKNVFDITAFPNEKLFFGTADTSGNVVFNEALATNFINDVKQEARNFLAPFSAALKEVTSTSDNAVAIDDFERTIGDAPGGLANTVSREDLDNDIRKDLIKNFSVRSLSENIFRLSEGLNENYKGEVDIFFEEYFSLPTRTELLRKTTNVEWTKSDLVKSLGKTIAHEIGHTLGVPHTKETVMEKNKKFLLDIDDNDVMAQGIVAGSETKSFSTTVNAFKIALGLPWSQNDGEQALNFYRKYNEERVRIQKFAKSPHDSIPGILDGNELIPLAINDGLLLLLEHRFSI